MNNEKLVVRMENGKTLEVVVLTKNVDAIWVVLGEGIHNVKCKLTPTGNGRAYVGSVMGREIVYERSSTQVRADIAKHNQDLAKYRQR